MVPAKINTSKNKSGTSTHMVLIIAIAFMILIALVIAFQEKERKNALQLPEGNLLGNNPSPHKTELVYQRNSYEAAMENLLYLKKEIEVDGYKDFYYKGKAFRTEHTIHRAYKLTWSNSVFDVNREVNNGRGAVDFTISLGAHDKTLVEFKFASNSKLKHLLKQTVVYEVANNVTKSIKVIVCFSEHHLKKVDRIRKQLGCENDPNIIVIDARNDKPSASKVV